MTLDTTSWPMLAGHGRPPPPKTWESDEAKAIARRDAKPSGSEKREGQVSSKIQKTELPLNIINYCYPCQICTIPINKDSQCLLGPTSIRIVFAL